MRFLQVDVFADQAYRGNALAVFLDAGQLSAGQMQEIAREMNLSESVFITGASDDSYDVRIFTPGTELPFAGHPTLGAAWALRHLGLVTGDELVQTSPAGETPVRFEDDHVFFTRTGRADADLDQRRLDVHAELARALSLRETEICLDATGLGRSGTLRPATADAGITQLFVPVRDVTALGRVSVRPDLLASIDSFGVYCFTAEAPGRIRARGLFPGAGISEDPATGSAAAGLGLLLADRLGEIDFEILQGVELGRPSVLRVKAGPGTVQVSGRCHLISEGRLSALPLP